MQELLLSHALHLGINKLNDEGVVFRPNQGMLITDLNMSRGYSGVIVLPTERKQPRYPQGYDLVKFIAPSTSSLDMTIDDLWECAKEHYGLTALTGIIGIGGMPISKLTLGYPVLQGASKYTNLVSHYGLKCFPMAKLRHGSSAARVARSTFGTIRLFGIIGRTIPFVALGLAVYDIISIGMCVYEQQEGKQRGK